jgi:hypothetical protein
VTKGVFSKNTARRQSTVCEEVPTKLLIIVDLKKNKKKQKATVGMPGSISQFSKP